MYAQDPYWKIGRQEWNTHACTETGFGKWNMHGMHMYAQTPVLEKRHQAWDRPVAMARLPEAKEITSRLWKSAPGQGGMLHMPEIPG